MPMSQPATPFDEGYDAFYLGRKAYENPYLEEGTGYQVVQWDRGWMHAWSSEEEEKD